MSVFKHISLLFTLSLLISCSNVDTISMQIVELEPAPQALSCATAFALNGDIYVFGGKLSDNSYSNHLYKYSVNNNQWLDLGQTPLQARVNPVAIVLNNKAYIGLGYNKKGIYNSEAYLKDFYQYDATTNQWNRLADYPDNRTNDAVIFTLYGYIYAGLGFNGFTEQFYRYDPQQNLWSSASEQTIKPFPLRCTSAVAVSSNNRAFVGTGYRKGSHNEWYEYQANTNNWLKRSSVPDKGRQDAAAVASEKYAYLFGGWHYGDTLTTGFYFEDIMRYNINNNHWQRYQQIPCGRTINMVAANVKGEVFFGLGEDPQEKPIKSFYKLIEADN